MRKYKEWQGCYDGPEEDSNELLNSLARYSYDLRNSNQGFANDIKNILEIVQELKLSMAYLLSENAFLKKEIKVDRT